MVSQWHPQPYRTVLLPLALSQAPRGEHVSLTVPTDNHIFTFSFFSGKTIRLAFSGISYLRTYLVHLVQFSRSVVSDSLRLREPQHATPPCPSPTPAVYTTACPLSQWCNPIISSSTIPFSSCLESFPVSGSFQMSQFFTSGGQSIGFQF